MGKNCTMRLALPFFNEWAEAKLQEYKRQHPDCVDNPKQPPKKGVARDDLKPLSLNRFETALWLVQHEIGKGGHYDLLMITSTLSDPDINPALVSVWKQDERFMRKIDSLRNEYAQYYFSAVNDDSKSLREHAKIKDEFRLYPAIVKDEILALGGVHTAFLYPEDGLSVKQELFRLLSQCNVQLIKSIASDMQYSITDLGNDQLIVHETENYVEFTVADGIEKIREILHLRNHNLTDDDKEFLFDYVARQFQALAGFTESFPTEDMMRTRVGMRSDKGVKMTRKQFERKVKRERKKASQ